MNTENHNDILNTRATLSPGEAPYQDNTHNECCSEELLFALRDTKHEFSLGLTTVLRCLRMAEQEGYVPPLSPDWWLRLQIHYGERIYEQEDG